MRRGRDRLMLLLLMLMTSLTALAKGVIPICGHGDGQEYEHGCKGAVYSSHTRPGQSSSGRGILLTASRSLLIWARVASSIPMVPGTRVGACEN